MSEADRFLFMIDQALQATKRLGGTPDTLVVSPELKSNAERAAKALSLRLWVDRKAPRETMYLMNNEDFTPKIPEEIGP